MPKIEQLLERAQKSIEFYGSMEEALGPTAELINGAKKSIYIVSDPDELNNSEIVEALRRTSERGVSISIAHGPETTGESSGILQLGHDKAIKLHLLDKRPSSHFMIVDVKHVIAENFHVPGEDKRIFFNRDTLFLGVALETEFKKLIS